MIVRLLGSSLGDSEVRQHLTTFLVDETIAFDAGSLGLLSPLETQRRVEHVFLSHSHIDHLATLSLFLDNIFRPESSPPKIYASRDVWQVLREDVFNDRLWANLIRIGSEESLFFKECILEPEVPVLIGGLTITPVAVDHTVPTFGFLIENDQSSVVIASDTGPTERIWELASLPSFRAKLRSVYLECSFPERLEWLAKKSGHLCPQQFLREIGKIVSGESFQKVAVHLKASLCEEICDELRSHRVTDLTIGGGDEIWRF